MSRKADIQAEEIIPGSPVRRSSRRTAITNSPAPATLSSRRNQSQSDVIETNAPKSRRASLSQENLEKNETTENKPVPRGRRGSAAKEQPEEKTEPVKTRSRRSSAAAEPPTEDTEKKQITTRRRKSTTAQEQTESESVKSRRSSVTDTVVEEDTVKKPVRSRRNSAKEEGTTEEPPRKILRSRRGSAAEETSEIEIKEKKPTSRGRKPSTDKLDDEPEPKTVKLTPIKSKRRLSITENAISLEPIDEQESETRKSTSPNVDLKKVELCLMDIKHNRDTKTNLDLSIINESSFVEEPLSLSNSEKKVTPRKSPRLEAKVDNSRKSRSPNKTSMMEKEDADEKHSSPEQIDSTINKDTFVGIKSPMQIKETDKSPENRTEDNKVKLKIETDEIESKEHENNETANESLEKFRSPRKKLFQSETTAEINTEEVIKGKDIDVKEEIHDKSDSHTESIELSVLEAECEQEKEYNKQKVVEKNDTTNPDTSLVSEESFKFHLSTLESRHDVENDLNISKNSSGSDKENIELNSTKDLNMSKVNDLGTQKKLKNTIESSDQNMPKEIQNVVCRVSNVFKPKMTENSFVEPMEVDESFLDTTGNKQSLDLEEYINIVPPAVSTPIVKGNIHLIKNKNTHNELERDMEGIIDQNLHGESFEMDKINRKNVESAHNSKVITINSKLTLGDSAATHISEKLIESKQEDTIVSNPESLLTDDIHKTAIEETKISNITVNVAKSEQSPKNSVGNVSIIGQEEQLQICESPLSDEEIKKEQEFPKESSFEITDKEDMQDIPEKSSLQMATEDTIKSMEKDNVTVMDDPPDVEPDNSLMLTKSASSELACPSEKAQIPEGSLRKSMSSPNNSEHLEIKQNKERRSSRKSRSPVHRQDTDTDQDKSVPSRKSKSPQPQIVINDELNSQKAIPRKNSENFEMEQILEKRSSGKPERVLDTQDLETDQVKRRKSKSPQPQIVNELNLRKSTSPKNSENSEIEQSRRSSEKPGSVLDSQDVETIQDNCGPSIKSKSPPQPQIVKTDELNLRKSTSSPINMENVEIEQNGEGKSCGKPRRLSSSRKSKSPQPQIVHNDKINLRKSTDTSESLEIETSRESKSTGESMNVVEGSGSETDQGKSSSPRNSKSPQPQIVNSHEELKSESNKILLEKSNNSDIPEDKLENVDFELDQDKINATEDNLQPEDEEVTGGNEILNMPELNNLPSSAECESSRKLKDLESEPEAQAFSPERIEDSEQESSKCNESGKIDMSEDYEFEIPSDEEEAEKTHNMELEGNTANSNYMKVATQNPNEFELSITEQVQSSSSPSIKSINSEVEQNKKNRLSTEIKANIQEDLQLPGEINTKIVIEPTNKPVMYEATVENATDNLTGADLVSSQDGLQKNENESKVSEMENIDVDDEPYIHKEYEQDNIPIQNEENISAVRIDTHSDLTVKKASPQTGCIEIETAKKVITEDELLHNAKNLKQKKKEKKSRVKHQVVEESSIETSNIDTDMDSDFQGVIQDSGKLMETKKGKKKFIKPINITKQNLVTIMKRGESQLDEPPEDVSVVKSKSPREKSKKPILKENNYEDVITKKTVKKLTKSKKRLIVSQNSSIESDTLKESKKSSAEAYNEEIGSSTNIEKKRKKQKKPAENVTCSDSDDDNENPKKPQKKTKVLNPNQIKIGTSAKAKLGKYLSAEIQRMEHEDESNSESDIVDDSNEENEFISTMAEEGEEDTPSDGSNDIIDEGESIHSTETEIDSDDSYDSNDSFICDDEEMELLSGEEFDLGNETERKKKKKSRIIQLDNCDDDIIKIKKKEKHIQKKKKSRIIPVSDSSDSDLENSEAIIDLDKSEDAIGDGKTFVVNKDADDDVIILEEESTPIGFSNNSIISGLSSLNTNTVESPTKKKRKSIIIHENINVAEIRNPEFSEKIANVVDSFCNRISGGELSMNLSLEHVDSAAEYSKYNKRRSNLDKYFKGDSTDDDSEEAEVRKNSNKKQRLSISLNDIEDSNELKHSSRKRKKSASLDSLSVSKGKKHKINRAIDGKKKNVEKASKKKNKAHRHGNKPPSNSPENLRAQTFSIMNQLITDVKNRPARTIKPSRTVTNMNGSWVSEIADIKPSTTLKKESAEYKPGKIHPKDFRTKTLYDPSRVRRVDTKTLLRKKGAYY